MTHTYDPSATLTVKVDGIGSFIFAMRTIQNQFRIEAEFCRLTEGLPVVTPFLGDLGEMVSDLTVLTVSGPKGWAAEDIQKMDAFVPATYENLRKVWSALRDKEAEFRGLDQTQAAGPQDGGDAGTPVPAEIQPPAD